MGPSWLACRDELAKFARIKTKLKAHQQRVVDRMLEEGRPGLLVAHGLGSGKTLTSIATQEALGLAATVIVPASLRANYQKERDKHIVGTSPEAALTSLQRVALRGTVPVAPMAIIDEAHRAREIDTKTYKALQSGLKPMKKRMLLTASPFYNRPSDIASLINLAANDHILNASESAFNKKYVRERMVKPGIINRMRGVKPGMVKELNPKARGDLQKVFRKWVDYHPNNTEGFPTVSREVVKVPMTKKQIKLFDAVLGEAPPWVKHKMKAGLPPSKAESKQLNAFMTAVRQVSLSTRAHAPDQKPEEPKIDVAFQHMKAGLASNKRFKGVVYSNYLETGLEPYKERLRKEKIPFGEFTGQLKKQERDQLVDDYNTGKKRVLLLSSAGGEGLDLKGTRLMQILEPHWNAEKIKQVEGRGIRYKSHDHLPKNERNVKIQNYLATRPRVGLLESLRLKKPGGGSDEYLTMMSGKKQELIDQFQGLMVNEG